MNRLVKLSLQLSDSDVHPFAVITSDDKRTTTFQKLNHIEHGIYEADAVLAKHKSFDVEFKVFEDELMARPHPLYLVAKDRIESEPIKWHESSLKDRKVCACMACMDSKDL